MDGALRLVLACHAPMESWLNVEKGTYVAAHLTQRVAGRPMPCVHIVDMRVETAKTGHVQIFSDVLLEALKLRLERGEQSILFLNRRGYATSLICPQCGAVAECPSCSVAYTYHQADTCLRCHICGGWRPPPDVCPECGDPAFKFSGFGTQREAPQARLRRRGCCAWMRWTTRGTVTTTLAPSRRRADILSDADDRQGTRLPNVTLVGVLVPTPVTCRISAGGKHYQLLAQVRACGTRQLPGRGLCADLLA